VGFFSAIGWNVAEETVNKPYLDPMIEKMQKTPNSTNLPTPPSEVNK
jgi:hypothetical protein